MAKNKTAAKGSDLKPDDTKPDDTKRDERPRVDEALQVEQEPGAKKTTGKTTGKTGAKKAASKTGTKANKTASKTTGKKTAAPVPATRLIGLSLGADICWPLCYEHILRELDLEIDRDGERVRVECERVTLEPFDLRQPCRYDVVLDRLTHWYPMTREWLKKAVMMDGLYVLNNPWSIQAMEKHSSYAAMMHLGLPVPETYMLPPKSYEPHPDLRPTLHSYAKLFDLGEIGERIGYPMFMKPYDGGGWRGVTMIRNERELRQRYEESATQLMHVQKAVSPFDAFVRCIGLGPQTRLVNYDPDAPLHDRYRMDTDFLPEDEARILRDMTLTINAFFGWDFNSCEALRSDGVWHPIDFANACPDSQVTSLHYHFPWLVMANLRWSLFCAVTRRPMRRTLDWEPFYRVAEAPGMTFAERLREYGRIAEAHFDLENFEAFCATHLGHLDEVAWNFFGTDAARDAIRQKVAALYPAHEIEPFTDMFFERVQAWRRDNVPGHRPAAPSTSAAAKPAGKAKIAGKAKSAGAKAGEVAP